MPKRVVHISSAHPAGDPRIFRKECLTLARAGYEVILVVPHAAGDEVIEGVQIRAVPMPSGRRERMLKTAGLCWQKALSLNAALYHFHDPELMRGAMSAAKRGHQVIYDVHEHLGEDLLVATNKPYVPDIARKPLSKFIQWYERRVGDRMAATIPVVESHVDRFAPGKSVVLQNYPIQGELPVVEAIPYEQRPNLAVFSGGLTRDRCAREMVEAIGLVEPRFDASFWVAGTFDDQALLDELAQIPGWKRTEFAGYIKHGDLYRKVVNAKVGLATMAPEKYEQDFSANKIYDYMMAGLPIIASPNRTWIKTLEEHKCGIILRDGSAQALADAMNAMFSDPAGSQQMGENGRRAALEKYTWEAEERKLLALYERLIGPP
ncbi:MAG: glycosyltransferase [Chthonomonas sp.]|nr:glycosyltransferase [Chthonomonas sp.]